MTSNDTFANFGARAHVDVADWREAIDAVGALLIEGGACTPEYVTAMAAGVEEFGPYIVVAPGVAIPHARPESGALVQGSAVITLSTPRDFGNPANDPVDTLIAFTAANKESHLESLQTIASLLGDDDAMASVRSAATNEELMAALQLAKNGDPS